MTSLITTPIGWIMGNNQDSFASMGDAKALVTRMHETLDERDAEVSLLRRHLAQALEGQARTLEGDMAGLRARKEALLAEVAALDSALEAKAEALEEVQAALLVGPPKPVSNRAAGGALTAEVISQGDDGTSAAVMKYFADSPAFARVSKAETEAILKRDAEDDEKLAEGIAYAVSKGVVEAEPPVEPIKKIDVFGKTADQVAEEIISTLPAAKAEGDAAAPAGGSLVVLQGLSGTGKGTTVAKLLARLPSSTAWSNGNVFRSLTLLALAHCEQAKLPAFSPEVLTPANLAAWMGMLSFGRRPSGEFDITIDGLGVRAHVSEVANTMLKGRAVGAAIPTVAAKTQGEVIGFAAAACTTMCAAGMNVILEGRAPTLAYVRSPHRFELSLRDTSIIGQRRAAQRLVGLTAAALEEDASADVPTLITTGLIALTKEYAV